MLKPSVASSVAKTFEYMDYVSEHSSKMDPVPPACGNEIDTLLAEIDEQIKYKKITPKDAATTFRSEAEAVFERASRKNK